MSLIKNILNILIDNWDKILTSAGFVITIWQTRKTKNSAEAAKNASDNILEKIKLRDSINSTHKINQKIDDLIESIRNNKISISLLHISSLRDDLISLKTQETKNPIQLDELFQRVVAIHALLEKGADLIKKDREVAKEIIFDIYEIKDSITQLSTQSILSISKQREKNVDS